MTAPDEHLAPYIRALGSEDPEGQLIRLFLNFKNQGGTQEQAEALLDQLAERTGAFENDKKKADVLEGVSCCITGYCSASNHIFRKDFEEWHFYRRIPPSA
jgi:hypothetical protein